MNQLIASSLLVLATFAFGCTSARHHQSGASSSFDEEQPRLHVGMTYSEVARAMRPIDPDIKDSINEILKQERDAKKEYEKAIAELRAAGIESRPKLNSEISLHSSNYSLNFRNQKLESWTLH